MRPLSRLFRALDRLISPRWLPHLCSAIVVGGFFAAREVVAQVACNADVVFSVTEISDPLDTSYYHEVSVYYNWPSSQTVWGAFYISEDGLPYVQLSDFALTGGDARSTLLIARDDFCKRHTTSVQFRYYDCNNSLRIANQTATVSFPPYPFASSITGPTEVAFGSGIDLELTAAAPPSAQLDTGNARLDVSLDGVTWKEFPAHPFFTLDEPATHRWRGIAGIPTGCEESTLPPGTWKIRCRVWWNCLPEPSPFSSWEVTVLPPKNSPAPSLSGPVEALANSTLRLLPFALNTPGSFFLEHVQISFDHGMQWTTLPREQWAWAESGEIVVCTGPVQESRLYRIQASRQGCGNGTEAVFSEAVSVNIQTSDVNASFIVVPVHGQLQAGFVPPLPTSVQKWQTDLAEHYQIIGRKLAFHRKGLDDGLFCPTRDTHFGAVIGDWHDLMDGSPTVMHSRIAYLLSHKATLDFRVPEAVAYKLFGKILERVGKLITSEAAVEAANRIATEIMVASRESRREFLPQSSLVFVDLIGHSRGAAVSSKVIEILRTRRWPGPDWIVPDGVSVTLIDAIDPSGPEDLPRPLARAGYLLLDPVIDVMNVPLRSNFYAEAAVGEYTMSAAWWPLAEPLVQSLTGGSSDTTTMESFGYPHGRSRPLGGNSINMLVPGSDHGSIVDRYTDYSDPIKWMWVPGRKLLPLSVGTGTYLGKLIDDPFVDFQDLPRTRDFFKSQPSVSPSVTTVTSQFIRDESFADELEVMQASNELLTNADAVQFMDENAPDFASFVRLCSQGIVAIGSSWDFAGDGALGADGSVQLRSGLRLRQQLLFSATQASDIAVDVEYVAPDGTPHLRVSLTGGGLHAESKIDPGLPISLRPFGPDANETGPNLGGTLHLEARRSKDADPTDPGAVEIEGSWASIRRVSVTTIAPLVLSEPTDVAIDTPAGFTMRVVATGIAPLQYQWRRNGVPIENDDRVSGSRSKELVFASSRSGDEGTYDCVISNSRGLAQSRAAIVAVTTSCAGDLNGDALVDDSDFSIFVVAYNTLDCSDPSMTPGCPADLNSDGLVDDTDFSDFAAAYDVVVCP